MNKIVLRESVSTTPVKTDKGWLVAVAVPGEGSSGTYSPEVLREYASKMLPQGAQAFLNHGEDRDPRDMIGIYPEGGYWSEENQRVEARLEVFSHWKEFVEEVGPHCGISLYAMGEIDKDGNVTKFIEDRYNGADLVARPGLIGSGLVGKLYESARSGHSDMPRAESSAQEGKDKEKMEEQIKALTAVVTDLAASVGSLVEQRNAEDAERAQAKADETAVTETVEKALANRDALEAAKDELLESQYNALKDKVLDENFEAALTEAKAFTAEARKEAEKKLTENATASGRIVNGEVVTKFGAFNG